MKTILCNCNHTVPLDSNGIARALAATPGASADGLDTVFTGLCRREAPSFQRIVKELPGDDELLVACTQESRLFAELAQASDGVPASRVHQIQFVNIRETAGWSRTRGKPLAATDVAPKIAALLALAQLAPADAVPSVSYRSAGRCLIIGPGEAAERAADHLSDALDVTVLSTSLHGTLSQRHSRATYTGRPTTIRGWLGAFHVEWMSSNPIDLDVCTRCNACIAACPEQAIGFDYQVDLNVCRAHRDCVRVCDAAGAINFDRQPRIQDGEFDMILDLRTDAAFVSHQLPQGYLHPGADDSRLLEALVALRNLVGEFEKAKFFRFNDKLCAHSRNEKTGCTACIDVCSARAIRSNGSRKGRGKSDTSGSVFVEPHLCVGCGACSTVCPSGAMSFAYPTTEQLGKRFRTLLTAYHSAGGKNAALLLHDQEVGTRIISDLGRAASIDGAVDGLPARVIPVPIWHAASVGLDMWLSAIALGASQVWVLTTKRDAPEYVVALRQQMAVAQSILTGMGYSGDHFGLIEVVDSRDVPALDEALRSPPAQSVAQAAVFSPLLDKRSTLDLAIEHLHRHAPGDVEAIGLPAAGSPFGTVTIDTGSCTLCLSCVGACPSGALLDNPDKPELKFIERNCVQCGLCSQTCPENAVTLTPRLWLGEGGLARRRARVLAQMEPWRCVKCDRPFGTQRAIERMVRRLSGHSAFEGASAERLKMCADCRVIDLHTNTTEVRITDL